jgi:small subunit ribosomal protein S2
LAEQLVKDLIDAGIHFGHRVSRWNPKMKPYIFGKRNLIHIIDVKETLKGILLAKRFLGRVVAEGGDVLFVGTKRQARKAIEESASAVKMHWVNDRWLGGALTNFREIRKRVGRLDHLEQLETDGLLDTYSKKEGSSLRREMRKIRRNLGGIRHMDRLPAALFVVDQRREIIAVREARKMGIPVICLLDTDCDPDLVDIPIPGNDDAMRAIELIVKEMCEAVAVGQATKEKVAAEEAEQPVARRRTRRPVTARAEVAQAPPPAEETPSAGQAASLEGPPNQDQQA